MKNNLRRVAVLAAAFVMWGLVSALNPLPANAIGPTESKVACSPQGGTSWFCVGFVADADPGADPHPTGTFAFFLDAISTSTFLGQCTLGPFFPPPGRAGCGNFASFLTIPAGQHTVWGVYYPAAGSPYSGSVGSDDVGNPAVAPPDPTDTRAFCTPTGAPGTTQPLSCGAFVVDDDSDPGPPPEGTVAFFLNAISSSTWIGQFTLQPTAAGMSQSGTITAVSVPPGSHTIWAVYYPAAGSPYQGSVDSDPIVV
jgi:hypothetical protein